jgi:hypothetical protein
METWRLPPALLTHRSSLCGVAFTVTQLARCSTCFALPCSLARLVDTEAGQTDTCSCRRRCTDESTLPRVYAHARTTPPTRLEALRQTKPRNRPLWLTQRERDCAVQCSSAPCYAVVWRPLSQGPVTVTFGQTLPTTEVIIETFRVNTTFSNTII